MPDISLKTKQRTLLVVLLLIATPYLLLAQSSNTGSSPEISISTDKGNVKISINLNEPFRWQGVRYESLKKFPQPWIFLPDLPHEIWFEDKSNMTWRQTDMMFIGNYKVLDDLSDYKMEASVLGYLVEIIGVFNPETNLLRFDKIDYAPFYKTPKLNIEESIDLINWSRVKLQDPPPKEYRWPLDLNIEFDANLKKDTFYRVKIEPN